MKINCLANFEIETSCGQNEANLPNCENLTRRNRHKEPRQMQSTQSIRIMRTSFAHNTRDNRISLDLIFNSVQNVTIREKDNLDIKSLSTVQSQFEDK